jgi:hypothetical protein
VLTFLPTTVAGISLMLEASGGLYWMVPALITGFLTAVTGVWVLLVEIHR